MDGLVLATINYNSIIEKIREYFPHLVKSYLDGNHYRSPLEKYDFYSQILSKAHCRQYLFKEPPPSAGRINSIAPPGKYKQVEEDGKLYWKYDYHYDWKISNIEVKPIYISNDGGLNASAKSYLVLTDDIDIEHYQFSVSLKVTFVENEDHFLLRENCFESRYSLTPLRTKQELRENFEQLFKNHRFQLRNDGTTFWHSNWNLLKLSAEIYRIDLAEILDEFSSSEKTEKFIDPKTLKNLTDPDEYERRYARIDVVHFQERVPRYAQKLAAEIRKNGIPNDEQFYKLTIEFQKELKADENNKS